MTKPYWAKSAQILSTPLLNGRCVDFMNTVNAYHDRISSRSCFGSKRSTWLPVMRPLFSVIGALPVVVKCRSLHKQKKALDLYRNFTEIYSASKRQLVSNQCDFNRTEICMKMEKAKNGGGWISIGKNQPTFHFPFDVILLGNISAIAKKAHFTTVSSRKVEETVNDREQQCINVQCSINVQYIGNKKHNNINGCSYRT